MPDIAGVETRAVDSGLLSGVIEGFYGPPWTTSERTQLFDWLAAAGLNTYLYAPKDDLKHRSLWRELYSPAEAGALAEAIRSCTAHALHFIYALGPGLDLRYSLDADAERLWARVEQLLGLGCAHFALLFDDVPDRMHAEDAARWGSLAAAQCHVTNAVCARVRAHKPAARFLFCPTPYCGRMAERQLGGPGYLETVGREMDIGIDILWTGPEIVSREITVAHARELQHLLRRKPIIWDNLHANDYDGRRFYCGPYSGRPPELRQEVAGILVNPNNECALNYVPVRTFGAFISHEGHWSARAAYLDAMAAWRPRFEIRGTRVALDDLVLLGDCFYLPYEEGPEASAMLASARRVLASDPGDWGQAAEAFRHRAERLRDLCASLAELGDRALFSALHRRAWELREELDLLLTYVRAKGQDPGATVQSDAHRPGTFRGGILAGLQRLLDQQPDGTFVSALAAGPKHTAQDMS